MKTAKDESALERLWYPRVPEGPGRRLAMWPLSAVAMAFGAAVRCRNVLYDRQLLRAERVEGARVVSVGNLTVGGAGKTPAVIHLANLAAAGGATVAILSRGYGRRERAVHRATADSTVDEVGDEPLLLARRCPGAAVWVGPDRVALARRARDAGATLLLLDDGMQHRRLARDAEVVVVDERVGFGNGRLLPRGPMREPLHGLRRGTLLWLRCDEPCPPLAGLPDVPRVRVRHRAAALVDEAGRVRPADSLAGARVVALAALARPSGFLRTLKTLGADVVAHRFFADHHRFSQRQVDEVVAHARKVGAEIVTTEKDRVRLPSGFPGSALGLEVEVLEGQDLLQALIRGAPPHRPDGPQRASSPP